MIRTAASLPALLLWALPATAQITADDVWANTQAYSLALGARQTAVLARSGDTVTVSQDRALWELPMGFGTLGYALSDYTMTENADGTVTITYPAPITLTVDLQLTGQEGGFATVSIGPDDIVSTASGTPGAVSYATTTGPLLVELSEVSIPNGLGESTVFVIGVESSETLTRVVEDSLTMISSVTDLGTVTTDGTFDDGFGIVSESTATYAPARSELTMALLPGGASILNLSGALRDGMSISAVTTSGGSETRDVARLDGEVFTTTDVVTGPGRATFRFDSAGLLVDGEATGLAFDMSAPDPFFPAISLGAAAYSGAFQMPLLASPDEQDFRLALALQDLRLGPGIWAMFDPDKALDRTPFQFGIDLSGTVVNETEWLDVLSLEGLQFEDDLPFDLLSLTVPTLTLSGLGASFAGDAALTFDSADMFTYPGFPRPTGTAGFVLTGLDPLLDMLQDRGILGSDDLFGVRMGLNMVTVPGEEPGVQTGRIELTEDGQIIANGQRLR